MLTDQTQRLIDTVQRNCHISDARHAGNYTLCVYLLKMREFYRWEKSRTFSNPLSNDDIGAWLSQREDLWGELEDENYAPIEAGNQNFDPFESAQINSCLLEHGLVYSGGIGHKSKPHFFIGKLDREQRINGYHILVSDEEYARDLTSPPAMSQGHTIYMRRESFKRMIWERTQEWRWNRPDNALAKAIACYDFDGDTELALDRMTDNELEAVILHEIGEIRAGEQLDGWGEMMVDITFTQAEIMARAVRDHVADMLSTLPALLQQNHTASIHFYFANLTSMRKLIFPRLQDAYRSWIDDSSTTKLEQAVAHGRSHWLDIAQQMLELHRGGGKVSDRIEALVSDSHL